MFMAKDTWEPDLILLNGHFRTMDENNTRVEAIAIDRGHIIATGSDEEIRELSGPGTETINLEGRLGLPGLMDSHFHFYDWALGRRRLDLANVRSFDELIEFYTKL